GIVELLGANNCLSLMVANDFALKSEDVVDSKPPTQFANADWAGVDFYIKINPDLYRQPKPDLVDENGISLEEFKQKYKAVKNKDNTGFSSIFFSENNWLDGINTMKEVIKHIKLYPNGTGKTAYEELLYEKNLSKNQEILNDIENLEKQ